MDVSSSATGQGSQQSQRSYQPPTEAPSPPQGPARPSVDGGAAAAGARAAPPPSPPPPPSLCALLLVGPSLEFEYPSTEAAWRRHAALGALTHLDMAVMCLNTAANAAVGLKIAPITRTVWRAAGLVIIDTSLAALCAAYASRAHGAYARRRVQCVAVVRAYRALLGSKGWPQECMPQFSLRLWLIAPVSGNLLLSGLALPLRWHLPIQALTAAGSIYRVPHICECAGLSGAEPSLCSVRGRLAGIISRLGLSLLPADWVAKALPAVPNGCCVTLLVAMAVFKSLAATTAVSLVIEAASRAVWLSSGAPGVPALARLAPPMATAVVQAARRELLVSFTAAAVMCLTSLPLLWEVCITLSGWALSGGPPSVLVALVFSTSVAIQVFMRSWLFLVLHLFIPRLLAAASTRASRGARQATRRRRSSGSTPRPSNASDN